MRSRHLVFLACATALIAVAACGDDDDSNNNDKDAGADSDGAGKSTPVATGLPKTDKLSSLDDEDAVQACKSTAHAFNTVLPDSKLEEIGCVLVAVAHLTDEKGASIGAGDVAECKKVAQDCLDGKPIDGKVLTVSTQVVDEDSCTGASADSTFSGCEASVADYESCAGKVASELKARFSGITCDGLKDPLKFAANVQVEIDVSKAAECKGLRDKCPDLDLSGAASGSGDGT